MTAPLYRALDPSDFAPAVTLDDFLVLYHRPSATTHLLDEPAPQILAALDQEPATPAEIMIRLQAHYGLAGDDAEAAIAARLAELAAAGLVETA